MPAQASRRTAERLKRQAKLAVALVLALSAVSVAAGIIALRGSIAASQLVISSNDQRQVWSEIGRLLLYRVPAHSNKSGEAALLDFTRTEAARLLTRSRSLEAEIKGLLNSSALRLVLIFHGKVDWEELAGGANVDHDLQKRLAEVSEYPDDLLLLGIETWGSEQLIAITSGVYLKPLSWLSDRAAELATVVQRRTTYGLLLINAVLLGGGLIGWRTMVLPAYSQWARGQVELRVATEELEERSARFHGAFRAITDAACLLSNDGSILATNSAFSHLFKISAQDASQMRIQNVMAQAGGKQLTASSMRENEVELAATFDGRILQLADSSSIVTRLSKAGPESWLFTAQTMGEAEKHLTKTLNDEHLKQLGAYTAGAAHDFSNVLAAISARGQILRASNATREDIDTFFSSFDRTLMRGKGMVSDMLQFARGSSLQPEFLSAEQLEQDLKVSIVIGENVAFSIRRVDDFALYVDRRQLMSALENICKNSLHAIGAEPGTLTIQLQRGNLRGARKMFGTAIIAIEDSGGGFSQAALERAFEPFFTTKGFGGGSGLGLAIVKRFVDQSGGEIRIRNSNGSARTEILLPTIDRW